MARPTKEEIAEWEARMNEPEVPDDDMVIIELPDGTKVHRQYSKVSAYLKKRGLDFDEVEIEPEETADDATALDGTEAKAKLSGKYFGKPKT